MKLRLKYVVVTVITAALLLVLVSQTDSGTLLDNWRRISPGFAVLSAVLFLGNVVIRGFRLACLAGSDGGSFNKGSWIRLSALHQLLFTVMPSGSGDASFPLLASRLGRCSTATATHVLLTYRLQDLVSLLILGCTALVLQTMHSGFDTIVLLISLVVLFALLTKTSELTGWLGRLTQRLTDYCEGNKLGRRWDRVFGFLRTVGQEMSAPISRSQRFHCPWITLLSWALATASLWSLFAMIDVHLSLTQTLIVVTGMNLVGAIAAFTIAGLGVSEGGLAGILFMLGFALPESVAIALIVRPAAVMAVFTSCGFVEGVYHIVRQDLVWTKRRAGTGEPRV